MMKRSRLRSKIDPKLVFWSKQVQARDGHRCRYPPRCLTGDTRLDAHHKASRSQRPDLKYEVSNGITLCRTHHIWLETNRAEALRLGLLSAESYELARKRQWDTCPIKNDS